MAKSALNVKELSAISARLGDTIIDPALWPEVLDQISGAVGAAGAGLLQSDIRTSDIPRSPGADEVISNYFKNGWYAHDVRAERGVPLLLGGEKVVTDQDIVTPEEIRTLGFYAENLAPFGFRWFAGVGFRSGSALWALAIQRTIKEGPFQDDDKRALSCLADTLTETATLSKAVGRVAIAGATNALDLVRQPALAIDRFGSVIDANAAMDGIFDDAIYVKDRRLSLADTQARQRFETLFDRMRTTPDTDVLACEPIVIRSKRRRQPVIVRVLPVHGAARTPFLGARALLVFSDLSRVPRPLPETLSQIFGLSPAEARVASHVASGLSPEEAADAIGISRATARNHLKAVFAKTATHRQAELVALLARL